MNQTTNEAVADGVSRASAWRRIAAAALAALGLGLPALAQAECRLKMLELPVRMVNTRAIVTVGINGEQVPLMVDTGAFFSMLSDSAAAQLNLKTRPLQGLEVTGLVGKIDARATTVDHMQLAEGDVKDIDFIVGGNELDAGAMGVIGRNILSFADTEFDLAHGMIRFVFPNDDCAKSNMAYWADDQPVSQVELQHAFREKSPALRAEIDLNGHQVTAMFDSGATTLVSLRAAHKAGLKDADMVSYGQMAGAGRGLAKQWTAPFDRVALGGEAVLHNRLPVGDFSSNDYDMLLGIDFFLSHHIYFSKSRSRMFFTYNGGPVFALDAADPVAVAASGAASGAAEAEASSADALARRGAASRARGDAAAALADLDRACAMEPDNAGFFASRASVHEQMRQVDLALADFDTALRLDASLSGARLQRAFLRADADHRDQVLQDLAVLDQTLAPQSPDRGEMAILYDRYQLPAQALAQWNLWIAAHKHDILLAAAFNSRCWARVELGIELDKALDDCDEAIDASPKEPNYLDSRGWLRLRQGKLQKALADFDSGLAIKKDSAFSLYGRGLVHLRLGEAAAAQADLAAARAADHDIDAWVKNAGLPQAPAVVQ